MDLDRYETECHRHCEELFDEVAALGIDRVRDHCRRTGRDEALKRLARTETAAAEYLRATPAQRRRLLRKVDEADHPLFLLGVLFQARCALALLRAVCSKEVAAGPSYRMVTSQAAAAALELARGFPTLWPFDDGTDPFDEG